MMKISCGVVLVMMVAPGCSPSRTILDYRDSEAQADSTDDEGESGSTTDDGGAPLLDVGGEPEPNICNRVGWMSPTHVSELVGPVHHDGNLYWGEWGQDDGDPEPVQTWRRNSFTPSETIVEIHASASSPAHSLVVDAQYLYASALDRNPIRIPVGGGVPEPIPAPLGYAESSSELLLLADSLYWLNHSIDEITLVRTQLEPLSSDVLLDGPLGEQLAGNEETGIFVLRPAGASTDILRVDPILGISEELISLAVTSENVGELVAEQDELYVVYTSVDTAQIDRVTLEGVVTTIVEPGSYTLITHPLVSNDQLYFEFADPEFAWGRVGLDGGEVEALGPEPDWNPQRWQPMLAFEDCLVYRAIMAMNGNNPAFEINRFPE